MHKNSTAASPQNQPHRSDRREDPDGTLQWCFHFQTSDPRAGGLIVGPGRVYFNTVDGLLWAVGERSPGGETRDDARFPTYLQSYPDSTCSVADGLFPDGFFLR